MKNLRKMLLLPIAALMIFAFGGCGGGSDNPTGTGGGAYPTELPDYEARKGEKEFVIWGYLTPPPTAQHFEWYADAGFNVVHIDPFVYQKPGQPEMYDRLRLAEEYGLKAIIDLSRGNPNDGAADMSANDYTDYPAFMGYRTDEPLTVADAEKIFENTALMNAKYPGKEYWVTQTAGPKWGHKTIEDTLKWFYGQAGAGHTAVSWDYYVLCLGRDGDNDKKKAENYWNWADGRAYDRHIDKGWLRIAEQYAKAAKDLDKDLYSFIASMSIASQKMRRPSEEDIRYQANVMLAYGSKGIEYFCYTTPGRLNEDGQMPGEFEPPDYALVWSPGYVNADDTATWERTETWYSAQKVNRELRAFEHVFLSFDWQGVMTTKGSDARTSAGACFDKAEYSLPSHGRIRRIEATEDAITGVFTDKDGYEGFMLVNFADPHDNRGNTVRITFKQAKKAVVYANGNPSVVDLAAGAAASDGVYEAVLAPGEGRFIIPIAG